MFGDNNTCILGEVDWYLNFLHYNCNFEDMTNLVQNKVSTDRDRCFNAKNRFHLLGPAILSGYQIHLCANAFLRVETNLHLPCHLNFNAFLLLLLSDFPGSGLTCLKGFSATRIRLRGILFTTSFLAPPASSTAI